MAQSQVDILKQKLDRVKTESESLLGKLTSAVDKETNVGTDDGGSDVKNLDGINTVLDTYLSFLMTINKDIHKISNLTSRMEALEETISTHLSEVKIKMTQLAEVQNDQGNNIQTVGETLNTIISFKIDNVDAKLQQMIATRDFQMEQHRSEIDALQIQVQEIQQQSPHVFTLKKNICEVTSRLYTLETTTDRFIKAQAKPLPQKFSTSSCYI